MQLILDGSELLLTDEFAEWLLDRIKDLIIKSIDKQKLELCKQYINKNNVFTKVGIDEVDPFKIIQFCVSKLTFKEDPDGLRFLFSPTVMIPGLDRTSIDKFIRFITYGDTKLKGYSIILDKFKEVSNNIDQYIDLYTMLYGGA